MANKERRSNAKVYSVLVLELNEAEPRRVLSHPNLAVVKTQQEPEIRFAQLLNVKEKTK